jgi:DNA-binding CsgD family transcriptional regulator
MASGLGIPLQTYDALLSATGTAALAPTLFEAIDRVMPVREIYGFELRRGQAPSPIVSLGRGEGASRRVDAYSARYYAGDPLGIAMRRTRPGFALQLHRIDPRDIDDVEYRYECYEQPRFGEKICLVMERGESWLVLSLFRPLASAGLSMDTGARLRDLANLVLPMLAKHRALTVGDTTVGQSFIARIEARLSATYPALTARERDVCARTLGGMTAEATAFDLGIGQSSVLTYRRRAYQRLGISSIHQLLPSLGL